MSDSEFTSSESWTGGSDSSEDDDSISSSEEYTMTSATEPIENSDDDDDDDERTNGARVHRSKRKRIESDDDDDDDYKVFNAGNPVVLTGDDDDDATEKICASSSSESANEIFADSAPEFTQESVSESVSLDASKDDTFLHDVREFTENRNYGPLMRRLDDNVFRGAREFGAVTNVMRGVADAAAQCAAWQLKVLSATERAKHTLANGGRCALCQGRKAVTHALVGIDYGGDNDACAPVGYAGFLCAKRYEILLQAHSVRNVLMQMSANGDSDSAAHGFITAYAELCDSMRILEQMQRGSIKNK